MNNMYMDGFEYAIGQRVRLHSGVYAYIARRARVLGIKFVAFRYTIVEEEDGKLGNGKILPVMESDPIVWCDPVVKIMPTDDGTRQSMIPGLEAMVSDKAKRKQRAA